VYDPYNAGGNRWGFDEGGNGSATWVPVVNNDSKTASYPILGWQSDAVHMTGAGTNPDPYLVTNIAQLQLALYDLDADYRISQNINADIAGYNTGSGFNPIGKADHAFTGTLQGLGHILSDLKVNRSGTDYAGLFGVIGAAAEVSDLELLDLHVQGNNHVGGVAGMNAGHLWNISITGPTTVIGVNFVGGFVGTNTGSIQNASSRVNVIGDTSSGNNSVGLAVGQNTGTLDQVIAAYATLTSNGAGGVLVGSGAGTVTRSFYDLYNSGRAEASGPGIAAKVPRMIEEVDPVSGLKQMVYDPEYLEDTSSSLMSSSTYSGWTDFGNTWVIDEGYSLPALKLSHPNGILAAWGNAYDTETRDMLTGKAIDLYINNVNPSGTTGTLLGTTRTSATGNYYFDMDPGDIESPDYYVTAKLQDDVYDGSASMNQGTKSMPGLNVPGDRDDVIVNPYVPITIASETDPNVERATRELDSLTSENLMGGVESMEVPEVVIIEEGSGADEMDAFPMNIVGYEEDYLLNHAKVSFENQSKPGREPVPLASQSQAVTSATESKSEDMGALVKGIVGEFHSYQKKGSRSGGKASSSGSSSNQGSGVDLAATVASLVGATPQQGKASSSNGAGNAESQSGNAGRSDNPADQKAAPAQESKSQDSKSQGSDETTVGSGKQSQREHQASMEKDISRPTKKPGDDFFDPDFAGKSLTNVRVVEGMVYVIDGVNDLSLLTSGESVRVVQKKPTLEEKLAAELLGKSVKPAALMSSAGSLAMTKANEPEPLTVVKEDLPTSVTKTGEPTPLTVVKADLPASGIKPDKVVFPSVGGKALSEALAKPTAAPAVTTAGTSEMSKIEPRYAVVKNSGVGISVKKANGEWEPVTKDQIIHAGDQVKTEESASTEVLLDGGSVGRVELQGGSVFRISKAEEDPKTGDKTTLLDLAVGRVLVHAGKLEGKSKFEVSTPQAISGVRGTIFEVTVKERNA